MRDQILVPFQGPGEGVEQLAWGQKGLWQTIQREGASVYMSGLTPLPAGTSVELVADMIGFLFGRHQALRTRLRPESDGSIRQVVSASGVTTLDVVDAGDQDPGEVGNAIMDEYQATDFDYPNEWPLRAAVIRSNGELTHMAAVYLHTALDAFGLQVLLADLANYGSATASEPVQALHPMDQARWQQTPAAQRQCDASLKHLERVLRTAPAQRFPGPVVEGEPTFPTLVLRSPATRLAVRMIAHRKAMDTSQILLGLYGIAVARQTGIDPFVTMLAVSNRFRPGLANSVSAVAQISPCLIELADITVDEAIGRARRAAVSAYKNAYYDPPQRMALIDRVTSELGEPVDLSCFFSDRRTERDQESAEVTVEQVLAALAETEHYFDPAAERVFEKLYLSVDNDEDAVILRMSANSTYLPPDLMVELARNIEAAAVEAATAPDTPTRVRPAPAAVLA
ncbi:MAG: condensation domain-containing protein [Jatrophihabitantaceae bacterium]